MRERFLEMRWALGLAGDDRAFADLVRRYGEPHRRHHTLAHVEACLGLLDAARALARRVGEVQCALCYHDAVYDPRTTGNEIESAALARAELESAGADARAVRRVERMILATETHTSEGDTDALLVLDADLSVLAADEAAFDAYERAVREEYSFVPDPAWRLGRRAFVERLLARPAIFGTPELRARFEGPARANLERTLLSL